MSNNQSALIQALMASFTAIPFNELLGLKLEVIQKDHAIMAFSMKNELVGNFLQGILHGGVISSVLDMAGGIIVMASMVQKHPDYSLEELTNLVSKCSTIDLHINYLRPGKGTLFTAKAWLMKSGNKIAFTRMALLNQDDKLIATGNGTYLMS